MNWGVSRLIRPVGTTSPASQRATFPRVYRDPVRAPTTVSAVRAQVTPERMQKAKGRILGRLAHSYQALPISSPVSAPLWAVMTTHGPSAAA